MRPNVVVVDYGLGNLLSVTMGLEHCGAEVELTSEPRKVEKADRLVLPGVGAFKDGMEGLRSRGLVEATKAFCDTGRPFLGICLGMQMMFGVGEEFGLHEGLNLLPGKVIPVPATGVDGTPHKVPHLGWSEISSPIGSTRIWGGTVLDGVAPKSAVYFVHSYFASVGNNSHLLAEADYDGHKLAAVVNKDNLYGCQFHPEKSGTVGLKMLDNFINRL